MNILELHRFLPMNQKKKEVRFVFTILKVNLFKSLSSNQGTGEGMGIYNQTRLLNLQQGYGLGRMV